MFLACTYLSFFYSVRLLSLHMMTDYTVKMMAADLMITEGDDSVTGQLN